MLEDRSTKWVGKWKWCRSGKQLQRKTNSIQRPQAGALLGRARTVSQIVTNSAVARLRRRLLAPSPTLCKLIRIKLRSSLEGTPRLFTTFFRALSHLETTRRIFDLPYSLDCMKGRKLSIFSAAFLETRNFLKALLAVSIRRWKSSSPRLRRRSSLRRTSFSDIFRALIKTSVRENRTTPLHKLNRISSLTLVNAAMAWRH